ncbi:MAG: site-specific integrase [Actinomycetes bacterium]
MLAVVQKAVELRGRLHFGPPKTRQGDRVVPLDAVTVMRLREHHKRQEAERDLWREGYLESGLVFTRENGEPLNPSWVTHTFRRLTQQAGLPVIRFHDLRHTSASLALAAGVPIKVVSHRLGHSTTAITADLYTHVVPEVARGAAEQIAGLLPRREEGDDASTD